jgi:hypothetical protein
MSYSAFGAEFLCKGLLKKSQPTRNAITPVIPMIFQLEIISSHTNASKPRINELNPIKSPTKAPKIRKNAIIKIVCVPCDIISPFGRATGLSQIYFPEIIIAHIRPINNSYIYPLSKTHMFFTIILVL